jgi:hypothetical protein
MLSHHHGVMQRLPAITAMFASRACRSAVMIGDALDQQQMTRVSHYSSLYLCRALGPLLTWLLLYSIDRASYGRYGSSMGMSTWVGYHRTHSYFCLKLTKMSD